MTHAMVVKVTIWSWGTLEHSSTKQRKRAWVLAATQLVLEWAKLVHSCGLELVWWRSSRWRWPWWHRSWLCWRWPGRSRLVAWRWWHPSGANAGDGWGRRAMEWSLAATSSWKAWQMDDLANVGLQSPRGQSTAAVPTAACFFSFDRWVWRAHRGESHGDLLRRSTVSNGLQGQLAWSAIHEISAGLEGSWTLAWLHIAEKKGDSDGRFGRSDSTIDKGRNFWISASSGKETSDSGAAWSSTTAHDVEEATNSEVSWTQGASREFWSRSGKWRQLCSKTCKSCSSTTLVESSWPPRCRTWRQRSVAILWRALAQWSLAAGDQKDATLCGSCILQRMAPSQLSQAHRHAAWGHDGALANFVGAGTRSWTICAWPSHWSGVASSNRVTAVVILGCANRKSRLDVCQSLPQWGQSHVAELSPKPNESRVIERYNVWAVDLFDHNEQL